MENCWYYKGECMYTPPEGYFGYLYKIEADGKVYFGKKQFFFSKKTKLSNKARLASTNKRKRIEYKVTDSDWIDYYSSCVPLVKWIQENGIDKVKREIISFCPTKIDLTYREMELLVKENVLFRDDCWNNCILNKFYKGRVTKL